MSLTNFSNIQAAEVQVQLENYWKEPSTAKSYTARANTVKAILENQTAVLSTLEDPEKKRDLIIQWVDFCGDTSDDGADADDCAPEVCAEGAGKTQPKALDIFITDCFSVSQEELETATSSFEEIVALGTAAKLKNMIQNFNTKAVAVIAANAGTNPFPGDYSYAAGLTTVPATDYGAEALIPYLMQVKELNLSTDSFLLDGGSLFKDFYIATKGHSGSTTGGANGVPISDLYADLPFRHDLPGFAANSITDETFMIDRGALAIANRAKFPSLQKLAGMRDGGWIHTGSGNIMRYSIPINMSDVAPMTFISQGRLIKQSLMVDVQYAVICDTDGKLRPTWSFKLRAGVFTNPIRCNTGNTGILAFKKDVAA